MDNQGNSPPVPPKKVPTAREIAESLKNFKPVVPFSFVVATSKAIRDKYR